MYKKILLTSNGSKNSEYAIRHAVQIASDENAELVVLHVVDGNDSGSGSENVLDIDELVLEEDDDDVLNHVARVIEELDKEYNLNSVRVRKLTVMGSNPAEVIVRVCNEKDIDMVVMANSGKNAFNRFFEGSVTEQTIREAPVPVLVIPANYSSD